VTLYFEAEFLMHGVLLQRKLPNGEWWLFVGNVNFSWKNFSRNVSCNTRTCRKVLSEHSLNCGDRRGKYVNPLESSSDVICYQVLALKNYVQLTECICGFCMDFETRGDYFPTQHASFCNRNSVFTARYDLKLYFCFMLIFVFLKLIERLWFPTTLLFNE